MTMLWWPHCMWHFCTCESTINFSLVLHEHQGALCGYNWRVTAHPELSSSRRSRNTKMATASFYRICTSHGSLFGGRECSSPSPRKVAGPTVGLLEFKLFCWWRLEQPYVWLPSLTWECRIQQWKPRWPHPLATHPQQVLPPRCLTGLTAGQCC